MVAIIPIPAFTDNYIWLLRDGRGAVVVDPGDAAPVLAYLAAHDLALTAILATHHHGDHVGGVTALLERFPVPVFGPARERIPGRTNAVADGDRIVVPGLPGTLAVLDIPGHTAGHVAYFGEIDGVPVLFCGDTLFAAGCGRLFEGTPAQMWASLSALAALPPATRVYCGHEYTLANLRFAQAVEPHNPDVAARPGPGRGNAGARRADAAVDDRFRARDQSVPARGAARGARFGGAPRGAAAAGRRRGVCRVARVEEHVLARVARDGSWRGPPPPSVDGGRAGAYHRLQF